MILVKDALIEKYGNGSKLKRRIYLISDEPEVIEEAKQKYSTYEIVARVDHAHSANMGTRFTDNSLNNIAADIYFLAHCQHLVCTFSSNVKKNNFNGYRNT